MIDSVSITVFVALFGVFIFLGFYGSRWRKGDLRKLKEWGMAGSRIGTAVGWFLLGADIYTAYTFIAVPSSLYAKGSIYFFAAPYVIITYAFAMWLMPKFWKIANKNGHLTVADFVRSLFNSRLLAISIAVVGIVAELPYIALQIVGMQAVLITLLSGIGAVNLIIEISLILSFIILAAFTWTSGLRGAALGSIMKDVLILITVVVVVLVVVTIGGFHTALLTAPKTISYFTLPPSLYNAYWSLFVLSALALYLYPHVINGTLAQSDPKKVRKTASLLPLYSVGLGFLAMFGFMIYGVPAALKYVHLFPSSVQGTQVVPGLIITLLPSWLSGAALLGIFIGGLVPAAIMAIAAANLFTRNIAKEIKPKMTPHGETRTAQVFAVIFKFLALGFVFIIPATFAIQLQLFGGILILQTLPAFVFGVITKRMNRRALFLGLLVGVIVGLYMMVAANHYATWTTTLIATGYGPVFIGLLALLVNIAVVIVGSLIAKALNITNGIKTTTSR
ncbi:MAG: sodium:solute symporter [Candidatus Marsarchaeota archaeon]|jgi:SSS family solute:Na+ symporter|nr:sodium:solute symporter [Candidatus Marsarchaeota archaeon]